MNHSQRAAAADALAFREAALEALTLRRKGTFAPWPFNMNRRFKAAERAWAKIAKAKGWRDARGRWRDVPPPPEVRLLGAG